MIIKPDAVIYDNEKKRYKVLNFIGSGGFASVFKIEREGDKSIWALKTLSESFQNEKILKGLINEGNLALKILNQNVIKYLFFHDGTLFSQLPPYIIMEFANQGALREILEKQVLTKEFFSNRELKQYFDELINGMEAISKELVHRDVKPENILIKDNVLKISDFGLSKLVEENTRSTTFKGFGTHKYYAPECWKNGKNTIKMDIYSMGIVFFELATLTHPLQVNNDDWQEAHLYQIPQNPGKINPEITLIISQVILKMIEKDASKRFNSWNEIRREFEKEVVISRNSELVASMIKRRLKQDDKSKAEELERKKQEDEIEKFRKLINYEFDKNIYEPLKDVIEEFNASYVSSRKIQIRREAKNKLVVHLITGTSLCIEVQEIIEEEFYRMVEMSDYGRVHRSMQLQRPVFQKRKISAWGYVKNQFGHGFNILAVEKAEALYNEWLVLWNTNSGLASNPRKQEPFMFNVPHELEQEIQAIGANHIYHTKVEPLTVEHFIPFIDESIKEKQKK